MTSGDRVRVDAESRSVAWRLPTSHLLLRGAVFLVAGVGGPVAALGPTTDPPLWLTAPVLLVTVATAGWLAAGLREGFELDDHGIRLDTGRRRPGHLPWSEVDALRVDPAADPAELLADTRDGDRLRVGTGADAELNAAVAAADGLGLIPRHVTVERPA